MMCKEYFMDMAYKIFKSKKDVSSLITKITMSHHPEIHSCYPHFEKNVNEDIIIFKNQYKKIQVNIIYYLSYYYGYLCICTHKNEFKCIKILKYSQIDKFHLDPLIIALRNMATKKEFPYILDK